MSLEELFKGRSVDIGEMMTNIKDRARKEGLPLTVRKKTYNTRFAQELGKWAERQGKGDVFHNAVFDAYFAQGKNIAQTSELALVAQSVGLSAEESQRILETREFKKAVDCDWSLSQRIGITAVPTFVLAKNLIVGAQPYESLENLLKKNNIKKRLAIH